MGIDIIPDQFETLCDGLLKKSDKCFYVRCCIAGTWHYCNDARLKKLIEKYGSIEAIGQKYVSREAKQLAKVSTNPVQKHEVEESKPISEVATRKAIQLEIQEKQAALEKKIADARKRIKGLSSPLEGSGRRACTPEEMRAIDVCWAPDYWSRNKFCDGCTYHLQNMCGCLTKEFKKKQK